MKIMFHAPEGSALRGRSVHMPTAPRVGERVAYLNEEREVAHVIWQLDDPENPWVYVVCR